VGSACCQASYVMIGLLWLAYACEVDATPLELELELAVHVHYIGLPCVLDRLNCIELGARYVLSAQHIYPNKRDIRISTAHCTVPLNYTFHRRSIATISQLYYL
jgi:hypothetical protein